MVDRNSANIAYTFWFYVCLHIRHRDCCSVADGNGSCHELVLLFFEDLTHYRRQKHRRRWPGNPNGRPKFCKYRVYHSILHLLMSTRSWLLLHDWRQRQLPRTHAVVFEEMTCCRCQKHRRWWPWSIEIPHLPKFMPMRASKTTNIFFAARAPQLWCHCTLFFSYYHWQRRLFSPTNNNFSITLTPPKTEIYVLKSFL